MTDFCRRHSSHFCPCVRPDMYRKDPQLAADWNEPLRRKKEDEVEPRGQRVRSRRR